MVKYNIPQEKEEDSMSIEDKFLQEDLQRIRGFRLMDDDFMSKCFEDYACVELVLRIILEKEDIKVEPGTDAVQKQKTAGTFHYS